MAGKPKTRAKRRQRNREAVAARRRGRTLTSEQASAMGKLGAAARTPESRQVRWARRDNYKVFPNLTEEQLAEARKRIEERERLEELGLVEERERWRGPRVYTEEVVEALAFDMVEYFETHPDCHLLVTWCNEKRIVWTRVSDMARQSAIFAEALALVKQYQEERVLKSAMIEETIEPGMAKMFLQGFYPWYRESWRGEGAEVGTQSEGGMLPATAQGCDAQIKMLEERRDQLTDLMERARSLPSAIVTE